MTRRELLAALDLGRIEEAIARAERRAAIELRVSVAGLFWGDAERVAAQAFRRLAMHATAGRNGLLLFVAPWRRRVVVFADEGITSRVDPALWRGVVEEITADFRAGRFTEGLVAAIDRLAAVLAPHLPPGPGGRNELPDAVDRGGRPV